MKTDDGFPLLRPFNQAEGGIGYTLLGFSVENAIDIPDSPDTPVFYFGDFSRVLYSRCYWITRSTKVS